ncbi:MAG TPA: DUF1186 domain-containing protein [Candidatus Hydrogenedentes bacterium]|jgi:hypothetical protein|nr:MAG: preprotein translocase subunit SecA [Candidatus Hydrogenedentes bacterium ADurb.Bin170]HNZ48455.1 DUF1186 domain-containing protein [Candidatus Hydrogenedentota bacterium]HOD94422.1 DUF1186 domain-containing protein [Candidatus Hydrogenedentota bacterium]HOH43282.1 DUF1186 domain-containing protein [Candidatus Hydrogenedentota bacterium]HOM48195.1 DUF1186 domain-containing protein [Candidatus Hydrogenedentota bacterium]
MELQEIFQEFEVSRRYFPHRAVRAAVSRQEEVTPLLLRDLEAVCAQAESLSKLSGSKTPYRHFFALYLLSQFREERAFSGIVDFFSLPSMYLAGLTSPLPPEFPGRALASTSGGDAEKLRSLAADHACPVFLRGHALDAMKILVAEGDLPREEAIDHFRAFFRGGFVRERSSVWDYLISASVRLHPEELYEDIQAAFDENLVERFFLYPKDVDTFRAISREKVMLHLRRSTPGYIRDCAKEMEGWGSFKAPKDVCSLMSPAAQLFAGKHRRPGANDPCSCGSGRKYKKCCGGS